MLKAAKQFLPGDIPGIVPILHYYEHKNHETQQTDWWSLPLEFSLPVTLHKKRRLSPADTKPAVVVEKPALLPGIKDD
ncbi:MAG: hypothetical protein R2778_12660 [Saprospiraceae bacterium]